MSDLEHLHSEEQSAELLWHMYKNAKNLLPYRYRMENLIWRMMFVKTRHKLPKDTSHTKLQLDTFIQAPLRGHASDGIAAGENAKEDFNYVAHIRKMSEAVTDNVPNRKRLAPMLPFMTHESNQDYPFSGVVKPSTHLNLSAAFRGGQAEHHTGSDNHGYSFQLHSFALEGPMQGEESHSYQEPTFLHQFSGGQSLPTTIPCIPTSILHNQSMAPSSLGGYGLGVNMNDTSAPYSSHYNALFPVLSTTAPQAIGAPRNSQFPANKRKTPLLLYDPSSFMYPSGPASVVLDSVLKQENSLISVSDHFASLRPYTPYELDDQSSVADSYFPGMLNNDTFPTNTPHRGSLVGPRMYEDSDSKLTYFDSSGQSYTADRFKQEQKLQYQNNPDAKKVQATNFWIDDYLNDSSSPLGSVSTAASGTNSGLNRVKPLPKKNCRKPKSATVSSSDSPGTKMEGHTPPVETKADVRPMLAKRDSKKSTSQASTKTIGPSNNIECTNCFTKTTPLWRRNPQGEPLCNACGLFLKLHGTVRPLSLKTDVIKKRQRGAQLLNQRKATNSVAALKQAPKSAPKKKRDGDDFFPGPIEKGIATFSEQLPTMHSLQAFPNVYSQTIQQSNEVMDAGPTSAGEHSPHADLLHPINEFVKEELDAGVKGEFAMLDGSTAYKGQWDWLSMNG